MCIECGHRQLHVFFVNGVHADEQDYSRIQSKLTSAAYKLLVNQGFNYPKSFETTLCYQNHNSLHYILDNVVGIQTRRTRKSDFGDIIGTALKTHKVLIIAHSYGSVFTYRSLEKLFKSKDSRELAMQYLYIAVYGGIQRFPKNFAKKIIDVRHVGDAIATTGHKIPKLTTKAKIFTGLGLIFSAPITAAPATAVAGGYTISTVGILGAFSHIRYMKDHEKVTELDNTIKNTAALAGHYFEDAYFDHAVETIAKIEQVHGKHHKNVKSEKCKKRGKIAFVATTVLTACYAGLVLLQTREQMFNPFSRG